MCGGGPPGGGAVSVGVPVVLSVVRRPWPQVAKHGYGMECCNIAASAALSSDPVRLCWWDRLCWWGNTLACVLQQTTVHGIPQHQVCHHGVGNMMPSQDQWSPLVLQGLAGHYLLPSQPLLKRSSDDHGQVCPWLVQQKLIKATVFVSLLGPRRDIWSQRPCVTSDGCSCVSSLLHVSLKCLTERGCCTCCLGPSTACLRAIA